MTNSDEISVHRTYFKLTKTEKFEFRFKHKQLMILSRCTFFKLSCGKLVEINGISECPGTDLVCSQKLTIYHQNKRARLFHFIFLKCNINWYIKNVTARQH